MVTETKSTTVIRFRWKYNTQKGAALLAKETGEVLTEKLPNWRVGMISALEDFATHYGQKPAMNRKLYNAKLKCYFYLFDSSRPDKRSK